MSFEGGPGVLNRSGRLNPLWLFARDLHNPNRTSVTGREARDILKSLYRGPQDLRRSDADFLVRKLSPRIPDTVKLRNPAELVDSKRFIRKPSRRIPGTFKLGTPMVFEDSKRFEKAA